MPRPFKTPALHTLRRRDLLDWMGSATVLSLGTLLTRCSSFGGRSGMDHRGLDGGGDELFQDAGPDGFSSDVAVEDVRVDGGGCGAELPFQPAAPVGGVFDGWRERTVDQQNLHEILSGWRLTIDGLVEQPQIVSFQELLCLPRRDQITDFHCVEGWSVHDVPWNGVALGTLLDRVRPLAKATHVTFHTIGGVYNESLPLTVAREPKTLLAYGVGGVTIPLIHGFPLRVVIPRLLGYKNAKYVERIELADAPINGFWVQHGYGYDGEVPASRLRDGKY